MLFNSISFLVFFIVITTAYYLLAHRYRWMLLLAASCYFYMFFIPVYILILAGTIVIDYFAGLLIEKSNGNTRKWFLVCSLIANVGVLAVFKYYNFLNENLNVFLHSVHYSTPLPYLSILLPIGLSFHTFQAMSYTIEVYKGKQKAEKHFGIYALYVMFYPQLVAGPIERPQNILPQLHKPVKYQESNLIAGLQMMIWGFFKKVVIADRLSVYVDSVYKTPDSFGALTCLVATIFFAIQIYCDFSGYSDIALGTAKALGISLMQNFNRPYIAKTVTEFWQRWHISLSTWFKDYVYIPLGGSRIKKMMALRNIFIVFILSGIWHGANWTFVIWGFIHGAIVSLERLLNVTKWKVPTKLIGVFQRMLTLGLVTFAWIFFRAKSLTDAQTIVASIFLKLKINKASLIECISQFTADSSSVSHFLLATTLILALFYIDFTTNIVNGPIFCENPLKQKVFYGCLIFVVLFLSYFKSSSFIYFQF